MSNALIHSIEELLLDMATCFDGLIMESTTLEDIDIDKETFLDFLSEQYDFDESQVQELSSRIDEGMSMDLIYEEILKQE
jgi:hypothetical protein